MERDSLLGTDFTKGEIMPLLLRFMVPFLLANLLNSIYNTVDTIIIGQLVGSAGTLAVSLGGRLLNVCTMISTSLAGGGQVLISQLYGAKKRRDLNTAIGTLFSLMLLSSVGIAAAAFFSAGPILQWMNTPQEAFAAARSYFRITCVGFPLMFGYNAVSSVLRGMGDSKSPLLFIAIAAAVNLAGDLVFVICFGLGAAGTAYATVIGQGTSLLFSLFLLYRRREKFGFDFRRESMKLDREKGKVILRIGLPMTLSSCCIQITQMVLLRYVNLYGVAAATTYAIGTKITQLTNIFSMSVRQASGTIVGQNIGAGRQDRVGRILRCSLLISVSTAAVLSVVSLCFPQAVFRCFTRDPAVIAHAEAFIRIICAIYFCSAILGPYDSIITGTGNALLGLLGGILDGVVFRIGFSFLFAYGLGMGVAGFFLGDGVARTAPIVIGMIYYHSGHWKRYHLLETAQEGQTAERIIGEDS